MVLALCNWIWRLLIAGVLLLFAVSKWREGISYLPPESIYDRFVAFSPWRHYAILTIEILIGLWVLSSVKTRWSSIAAGLLFTAFTAILAAEIFRASPDLCGCGIRQVYPDGDPRVDLGFGIARNLLLLLGCGWLWLMSGDEPERSSTPQPHQEASAN